MSQTNVYGPNDIQAIEIRLYPFPFLCKQMQSSFINSFRTARSIIDRRGNRAGFLALDFYLWERVRLAH